MDQSAIFEGYAADAANLVPRFEALDTEDVLAPVMDLLPPAPCRCIDVGAGTGRDAAWLAGRGHHVVAVEPVDALRHAGMALHRAQGIEWLADSLPSLSRVRARSETFDLVLCVAVLQHLPAEQHEHAMASISAMVARTGRAILSVRHGPGAPSRPCFAADTNLVVAAASNAGLKLAARREAVSVQQRNRDAGVTWDWLCFDRSP